MFSPQTPTFAKLPAGEHRLLVRARSTSRLSAEQIVDSMFTATGRTMDGVTDELSKKMVSARCR